jgi:hypothetical protein
VQEVATKLQGGKERMGKEGAGRVEKAWLEGGADVHQVRLANHSTPAVYSPVTIAIIGKMGWSLIGKFRDGSSSKNPNLRVFFFSGRLPSLSLH